MSVRINNIYEDKIKFKNIYYAYKRACKGKKQNKEVILFELDLANIGVRIDIWTHFMRGCIIDYVH